LRGGKRKGNGEDAASDGVTGFPNDLWSRQSTDIRSTDRLAYLDHTSADRDLPLHNHALTMPFLVPVVVAAGA
jgi:uncharacterized protein (UPF0147 family)